VNTSSSPTRGSKLRRDCVAKATPSFALFYCLIGLVTGRVKDGLTCNLKRKVSNPAHGTNDLTDAAAGAYLDAVNSEEAK